MSDSTPRTDAAEGATLNPSYEYYGAEAEAWEFARQLELELAEAKKDTARLHWILNASADTLTALDQWDRDNIDDEINREENQND